MLDDDLKYLKSALGMKATATKWDGVDTLPLFLRSGTEIAHIATTYGCNFLLARPTQDATLPDIKRLHTQLSQRTDMPVAVSAPASNARQRHALVAQSIPFVCAGKQVSLPFLGAASTEWGKGKLELQARKKLSPKAQQAALWGAKIGRSYTLAELRDATNMSASQASEAVDELAKHGMVARAKLGRLVTVSPIGAEELLTKHMENLSSPTLKTLMVRKDARVETLPDAGETALASRTALNSPAIKEKAAYRNDLTWLQKLEVLEGELPDNNTARIQIWKYEPLFKDCNKVDDISLALSFVTSDDERIESEVCSLFGKEYPWHEAQ